MPCNSDHMNATNAERELSRVACLLDELSGKKKIDKNHWAGYHPRVYCMNVDADALVSELCEKLQSLDVSAFSLEMQIWWRDHQEADKKKLEKEVKRHKDDADRAAAIAKLTPYERKLLGV